MVDLSVVYLMLIQSFSSIIMTMAQGIVADIKARIPYLRQWIYKMSGWHVCYVDSNQIYNKRTGAWYIEDGANWIYVYIEKFLSSIEVTDNVTILGEDKKTSSDAIVIKGIHISHSRHEYKNKDGEKTARKLTFTIYFKDKKSFDEFLNDAKEYYNKSLVADVPKNKYLSLTYKTGTDTPPTWKQYSWSSQITFDKLFFPQKDLILTNIKRLAEGKITKLALLLSGFPGCGKTSIIKAIANLTGKNIINVNLNKIGSLEMLHQVFFDPTLNGYNIPVNTRIIILEEVDTYGDLVEDRSIPKPEKQEKKSDGNIMSKIKKEMKEKLSLGDLLTTFDGIQELNGAIVILTTNHPEKLDPALIREGRIQLHCELQPCLRTDALKIIKSYPDLAEYNDADYMLSDGGITPARLGAYCQMSDTPEDLNKLLVSKWKQ